MGERTVQLATTNRTFKMRSNRLGYKALDDKSSDVVREQWINKVDKYLECEQYDGKLDWLQAAKSTEYVAIRDRKPLINMPVAHVLTKRLASKLLGEEQYPSIYVTEDEDTTELWKVIEKNTFFEAKMLEAAYMYCAHGAVFVRFKLVGGNLFIESHNVKYCYPIFNEAQELTMLEVKYVYTDVNDVDKNGKPKQKWYRLMLGMYSDILFDNPEYKPDVTPVFNVVNEVNHNLGFVQGEWIRNCEKKHSPDGTSFIELIMDFIDAINYNLSQSDNAVSYSMDPQLILKGMTEDDMDMLVKSSSKGWALGREGEATFLEANGTGVEKGVEHRTDLLKKLQDTARIVMLDPDKIIGSAQSGKAMEILHGPLVELIYELRPYMEKGMKALIQKMVTTLVLFSQGGADLFVTFPAKYKPTSLDFEFQWGEVFPPTMLDLAEKTRLYTSLASANIISRETALRKLAPDLGIPEDEIEAEVQKVNTQQQFGFVGGF